MSVLKWTYKRSLWRERGEVICNSTVGWSLKVLDTLEKNLSAPSRSVISRSRQLCRSYWPWSPSEVIIDGEDVLVLQLVLGDTESADPMIMRTESAHLGVKDDLEPRRESSFLDSERSSTCSPSSSSLKIIVLSLSSLGVDQTTINSGQTSHLPCNGKIRVLHHSWHVAPLQSYFN